MALKSKSARGVLGTSSAVLLAASATKTIYVRGIHFKNMTIADRSVNYAFAATATSSGPGVFGMKLSANSAGDASRSDIPYYGKGHRLDNTAVSGFADLAGVTWEIEYDESDTLDAT